MKTYSQNCPFCLGEDLQCTMCIPEPSKKEAKEDCARYARRHYAKHKSILAALDECYESAHLFPFLTRDEIYDCVFDAIEEYKEDQSEIHHQ